MGIFEMLVLALALSMDAFSVAISKGLAAKTVRLRHMITVGLWFGGFQALMPLIGYLLADVCSTFIETWIPWIAFALLVLIGLNMIRESVWGEEEEVDASFGFKTMLVMAVATSIDAMVAGVGFVNEKYRLVEALIGAAIIGVTTFLFSSVGVKIGRLFGCKCQKTAEIAGGVVLVLLGIWTLVENFLGI